MSKKLIAFTIVLLITVSMSCSAFATGIQPRGTECYKCGKMTLSCIDAWEVSAGPLPDFKEPCHVCGIVCSGIEMHEFAVWRCTSCNKTWKTKIVRQEIYCFDHGLVFRLTYDPVEV